MTTSKYDPESTPKIGFDVIPSPPDDRDHVLPLRAEPSVSLPFEFVQPHVPIRNQDGIGACGAFGSINALEYEFAKQGVKVDLSEQFQYAVTREYMQSQQCADAGSVPREAMRVLVEVGAVTEALSPFLSQNLCWRPDADLRLKASQYRALEYYKPLASRASFKQCLYGTNGTDGSVVAYCTLVGSTFNTDSTGTLINQGNWVGAHWMSLVGWSDSRQAWRVRNQWGSEWGDGGYCWIPYADAERDPTQGGMWVEDAWAVRIAARPAPTPDPVNPCEKEARTAYSAGYQACWQENYDTIWLQGWYAYERALQRWQEEQRS